MLLSIRCSGSGWRWWQSEVLFETSVTTGHELAVSNSGDKVMPTDISPKLLFVFEDHRKIHCYATLILIIKYT
jgi:hypothetical protein